MPSRSNPRAFRDGDDMIRVRPQELLSTVCVDVYKQCLCNHTSYNHTTHRVNPCVRGCTPYRHGDPNSTNVRPNQMLVVRIHIHCRECSVKIIREEAEKEAADLAEEAAKYV